MAFDQPTRNRLAAFVGDARAILTEEFTHQLQADYGLNPERGEVMALDSMQSDNARRATAELLRETLDYYLANSHSQGAKARKEALERIVREQAFTVLNRLCALRMAEARGLLLESIGSGYKSKGFKLYGYMTGSALGETGDAYRAYLFSLFDEFAVDLPVLFDRFSPEGRLFPAEKALLALLAAINHPDLAPLWGEDETIGWIYQYFNSQEERRKMRAESQAPRNSRELAVRNQFFTPRYVVEFLTDNTLGRTWYEMTVGRTQLANTCRYLVRRPLEIFLNPVDEVAADFGIEYDPTAVPATVAAAFQGDFVTASKEESGFLRWWIAGVVSTLDYEKITGVPYSDVSDDPLLDTIWDALESDPDHPVLLDVPKLLLALGQFVRTSSGGPYSVEPFARLWSTFRRAVLAHVEQHLTQEELLRQPVFIPARLAKDPRAILMLDPACGSMHFGLYSFDLFETIYSEAWDFEAAYGPNTLLRPEHLRPLLETYPDKATFLRDVPRLIVEHNIHGIDIDPRAVQIASLSLWQRAQRSWHAQGVKPTERPSVHRSNIVCAEPMPGDKVALQEFVATLEPKLLGELVTTIFDKMELAGEAGSLLKIEDEIRAEVESAQMRYQDYLLKLKKDVGYLPGLAPERDTTLVDLMELPDPERFWATAEELVVNALKEYAAAAANVHSYTRRLFAQDAEQGFAFIDVCRKRYDVVLMNPPFGEASQNAANTLEDRYPSWNRNLLCAFIERYVSRLTEAGTLATVIDRSLLNKSTYERFRQEVALHELRLTHILDLGWGVLDANVEVSSFITMESRSDDTTICIDLRSVTPETKEVALTRGMTDDGIDSLRMYIHPTSSFRLFPNSSVVYDLPDALLTTFSRFENISTAGFPAYTGHQLESQRHFMLFWELPLDTSLSPESDFCHLYNGGEYSRYIFPPRDVARFGYFADLKPSDVSDYTFVLRNKDMQFRSGVGFGKRGDYLDAHVLPPGSLFTVEGQILPVGYQATALYLAGLLNSAAVSRLLNTYCGQHKYSGYINLLPCPSVHSQDAAHVARLAEEAIMLKRQTYMSDETTLLFVSPGWLSARNGGLNDRLDSLRDLLTLIAARFSEIVVENDLCVCSLLGLDDNSRSDIQRYALHMPKEKFLDIEASSPTAFKVDACSQILSYAFGVTYGRWDIRYTTGEYQPPPLSDVFDPYPVRPPGMLQNLSGAPATASDELSGYPFRVSWSGILVDDSANPSDIERRVLEVMEVIWPLSHASMEQEMCQILGVTSLRDYISTPNRFFTDHLNCYSKSRRMAPIYWPLSTASGSYTIWLYYHRLTNQTLYQCVNDFVDLKRRQVTEQLADLQRKLNRSRDEERALDQLATLDRELGDFRAELLRVAAFWEPNLNDGVQITASPLYRLFSHRPWRKRLQETWEKLEEGEYDWAHLAYSIWPERVREKCRTDKSLALAHDLEHLYVEPAAPAKSKGKRGKGKPAADADAGEDATQAALELNDVD